MIASHLRRLGLVLAALFVGSTAHAAGFTEKPVDYVIPFGKGGESDISAQLQAPFFKEMFGVELNPDYKPGGGGALAWKELNDLPGDGYTIMGVNLPHIVLQSMRPEPPYNVEDLTPVYWFHYTPDAIIVPADGPYQTLADLIAAAKEAPGTLTFSGSGEGTANHLAQVTFDKLAGIETTYIPFKGTGAALTALNVGQVSAQWGYTTAGIARRGAVKLLAVAMEERHPSFPDVPTFRELGYEMVGGAYRGIALPKSASEETRKAWSDMIGKVNTDPKFRQKMQAAGFALVDIPYGGMDAFMKDRIDFYVNAAKQAGVL
ncbi:MAG: tripartite tricarboxylate transporter substrate binding protein [Rhodobiaceae bacterium]|nr:tripartite tricarboxylate transporter substrate binding protein [Rhodobiaceae bacterium]